MKIMPEMILKKNCSGGCGEDVIFTASGSDHIIGELSKGLYSYDFPKKGYEFSYCENCFKTMKDSTGLPAEVRFVIITSGKAEFFFEKDSEQTKLTLSIKQGQKIKEVFEIASRSIKNI